MKKHNYFKILKRNTTKEDFILFCTMNSLLLISFGIILNSVYKGKTEIILADLTVIGLIFCFNFFLYKGIINTSKYKN